MCIFLVTERSVMSGVGSTEHRNASEERRSFCWSAQFIYQEYLLHNMKQPKRALKWIVNMLKKDKIPYQIVGGLAAKAYGAKRPLFDIDIYIPDKYIDILVNKTKRYIEWGPKRVKEKNWDLEFFKIKYAGTRIDIGSPEKTKIFDNKKKRWFKERIDFSKSILKEVYGIDVPIMPKKQLIQRKRRLGRKVDLIDLEQMRSNKN